MTERQKYLLAQVERIQKDEKHDRPSESRFWCQQWRLLAEVLVKEVAGTEPAL